MRIGLDIHGVITRNPNFFSLLSQLIISEGNELHIITGSMLTEDKINELKGYGVEWTHLFSISDYHKHLGTPMTFSDPDNPWIDGKAWDKTKSKYCADFKIDFHIDDTERYGEYFKTPFALYDHDNFRFDWHYMTKKNGAMKLGSPEETWSLITKVVLDTKNVK